MSNQSIKVIVLRKIKYKDSDLIIHGLSPSGVKLSFLAKGAVKSKKRFGGGVLDPFHFIEVTIASTKSTHQSNSHSDDLKIITEAKFIRTFDGIKTDYDRLQLGYYFLEAINKVTQQGESQDSALYDLLGHSLITLENAVDLNLLKSQFVLKFLMQQGVLETELWMKGLLSNSFAQVQSWSYEEKKILNFVNLNKLFEIMKNYILSAQAH